MKYQIITALLLLAGVKLSGQKVSFEYGVISDYERNYTEVDFEPGAPAVIFFNIKNISYETGEYGYSKILEYKFRAKVLKPEGKYYSDHFKIPFVKNSESESFKFHTINYENGKELITELDEDDFFEEKIVDDYYNKVVILKNVKVGTIIEYSIKMHSKRHWYIYDWHFQKSMPVIHSEINAKIPSFYFFRTFFQNCDSVNLSTTKEYKQYMNLNYFGLLTTEGAVSIKGLHYTFIKNNLKSFKNEPLIGSINEYREKAVFQLTATHFPGESIDHIMTTWEDLHSKILEHDNIYKRIGKARYYSQIINEITTDSMSSLQKIEAIYNYVKLNTNWNGSCAAKAKHNLFDVLKQEVAAYTSDINLILINLLRQANIEAYPVFISTRSNGKPYKDYPVADQFNSLIAYCEFNNSSILLDAHIDKLPYSILPQQDLNYEGWVVKEDTAFWIALKDASPSKLNGMVNIDFDSEHNCIVNVELAAYGQVSNDLIKENNKNKNTLQIPSILTNQDVADESFSVKNYSLSPLELSLTTNLVVDKKGEMIYFEPNIIRFYNSEISRVNNRKYPIDFIYNDSKYIVYTIKIPDGYFVKDLPQSIKIKLLKNSGDFLFTSMHDQSNIRLIYRLNLNETLFSNENFEALEQFYEKVLVKQNAIIVFQKKD